MNGSGMPILTGEDMYRPRRDQGTGRCGGELIIFTRIRPPSEGSTRPGLPPCMRIRRVSRLRCTFRSRRSRLYANAHIAAGIPDFLAWNTTTPTMSSWFDTLVDGVAKPMMQIRIRTYTGRARTGDNAERCRNIGASCHRRILYAIIGAQLDQWGRPAFNRSRSRLSYA